MSARRRGAEIRMHAHRGARCYVRIATFTRFRIRGIVPQVSWTDSPARDIVHLAIRPTPSGSLSGFNRPVLSANFCGGTVREIVGD
jgi:hypothetical protein